MRTSVTSRLSIVMAAFALAACSGDATAPSSQVPNDLGQLLGQFSLPAVASATAAATGVPLPTTASAVPSSCAYSASSKSFACATVTSNGLTITRSYMLFDANGTPQSAFDAKTTSSIRMMSSVKGTVTPTSGSGALTIDQQDDMTLSGLLGSTRVMNGTSSAKITGTVSTGGTQQPISTTSATTIANLTMPATAMMGSWPTSGTITSDNTSSGGGTSVHLIMQMSFDGTSKVAITMTIDGRAQRCTMDMSNPGAFTCS